jgi:hypothetical protein
MIAGSTRDKLACGALGLVDSPNSASTERGSMPGIPGELPHDILDGRLSRRPAKRSCKKIIARGGRVLDVTWAGMDAIGGARCLINHKSHSDAFDHLTGAFCPGMALGIAECGQRDMS